MSNTFSREGERICREESPPGYGLEFKIAQNFIV